MAGENYPAGVDKKLVSQVLNYCEIASQRQEIKHTDFLDPFHRDFVRPLISNYFGIRHLEAGGYPGAERQRLIIFPDYYKIDDIELPLAAVEIQLSDSSRMLSHGDYLGALLAYRAQRSEVGDIIVLEGGAQAIVAAEVVNELLGLQEVNRFKAEMVEIPPYQIKVQQQPQRIINSTVASVRLDAIVSAGLGIGRGKAADFIKADRVKVNWRRISQPSFQIQQGDVISIRGRGRLELDEVGSKTRKGRTRITLQKYT